MNAFDTPLDDLEMNELVIGESEKMRFGPLRPEMHPVCYASLGYRC